MAQLGPADMRVPIRYALTYPERVEAPGEPLSIDDMRRLTFERPDADRFEALALGFRAARAGGTAGAVLNAANEVAVAEFLAGRCAFTDIARVPGEAMDAVEHVEHPTLEDVWAADGRSRAIARTRLAEKANGNRRSTPMCADTSTATGG